MEKFELTEPAYDFLTTFAQQRFKDLNGLEVSNVIVQELVDKSMLHRIHDKLALTIDGSQYLKNKGVK